MMTTQEKRLRQKIVALRYAANMWSEALWMSPTEQVTYTKRVNKRLYQAALQYIKAAEEAEA